MKGTDHFLMNYLFFFFPHRWVGAISGLAYIFMLPCVTYMYALYTQDKLRWYQCIIHSTIILIGIGNFISQFMLG